MKTLHWYVTRQVLANLVMAVAVFSFILLAGIVLREVLLLLVNNQAPLGAVFHSLLLLTPFVLVFALPMGLLTATLLVFGRFSADHELTAVRAGGVSLAALVTPVLLVGLALSVVCAVLNMEIAPRSRLAYKNLLLRQGVEKSTDLIAEGRFIQDFPGYSLFVQRRDGNILKGVMFHQLKDDVCVVRVNARSGRLERDATRQRWTLHLYQAQVLDKFGNEWQSSYSETVEYPIEVKPLTPAGRSLKLNEMTFAQLWRERKKFERQQIDTTPVLVQMTRQVSFSFACVGFVLVGIPLGVRGHHRETSTGVFSALLLVVVYYAFFIVGQAMETRPERVPHLVLWLPNFLFQGAGAWLLWRSDKAR